MRAVLGSRSTRRVNIGPAIGHRRPGHSNPLQQAARQGSIISVGPDSPLARISSVFFVTAAA